MMHSVLRIFAVYAVLAVALCFSAPEAAAQSASICNTKKIAATQAACFRDLALSSGNPGVCESARDPAVRFQCLSIYAEKTGDVGPCSRIIDISAEAKAETLSQACVAGAAVGAKDPRLCQGLNKQVMRDSCFVMLVTRAGMSSSLCNRVSAPEIRKACHAQ